VDAERAVGDVDEALGTHGLTRSARANPLVRAYVNSADDQHAGSVLSRLAVRTSRFARR
jgi:hypothetical protein